MSAPILLVDDPCFDAHEAPGSHPERPERLAAAREGAWAGLQDAEVRTLEVTPASADAIDRVHGAAYRQRLLEALDAGAGYLDPDTYFCKGSRDAAFGAAGAAASIGRCLAGGEATRALALVRPPGHHAAPDRPMGFCLLNNIAIAAAAALDAGVEKVAIVDFDVHHGNGTQAIWQDDPRVLFISTHEFPQYPGTGRPREVGTGAGVGYTANVALPTGTGPAGYGDAFRRVVVPLLSAFDADLLLVSAGFDGHRRDPIGGHEADDATYAALVSALCTRTDRPVGLFLEGGYDLPALRDSVCASARALTGQRTALPEDAPPARVRDAVSETVRALRPHWPAALR